jgi:hypothetical protein
MTEATPFFIIHALAPAIMRISGRGLGAGIRISILIHQHHDLNSRSVLMAAHD